MYSNTPRPKWWQVYLTFPLLIALFMLDHSLNLSERGHEALQIGILLLVYGLVHLWMKANEAALSDYRQYRGAVIISKPHVYKLENTHSENRALFQLPDHEINNTLTIDAEFFSAEEVSQEIQKE